MGEKKPKTLLIQVFKYSGVEGDKLGRYSKYFNDNKFEPRIILTGHWKETVEFGAEW